MESSNLVETQSRAERRRTGMRMLARGVPATEVARHCEVRLRTVAQWQRNLRDDPAQACNKTLGRPMRLDAKQEMRLLHLLLSGAIACGYTDERWTQLRLAELVKREFGIAISRASLWRALRRLGLHIDRASGYAIATPASSRRREMHSPSHIAVINTQMPASLSAGEINHHAATRLTP